jgi:phage tail protein X
VSAQTTDEIEPLGGARVRAVAALRLDILAKQLAGTERAGRIEALLDANPGLARGGPYVGEGTIVTAPARAATDVTPGVVNPWE